MTHEHVGYGVTKNGQPTGMWPQSYEWCVGTRDRLASKEPNNKFEIVPVFQGAPVQKPVVLPGINKGDSA